MKKQTIPLTPRKWLSMLMAILLVLMALPVINTGIRTDAKTVPNGETVNTALFYAQDSDGKRVLVSQIPMTDYAKDNEELPVHNYSLLDRYVTPIHQEATGLSASEFVKYAQGKSTDEALKNASLQFVGDDQMAFWEIDQTGYDDMDTYTYDDLYGVERYNFPRLYKYWNYTTQDYYDPDGEMTREQVIDYIWEGREPETMLLSATAFSQRFMITEEKYDENDFNMENYWTICEYLDTQRSVRMMIPMTESDLRNKVSTASNTRYWVSQILLMMKDASAIHSKGTVAAPTGVLTENEDSYFLRLACDTPGATIYFNHNYQSPSYMPTCPYDGEALEIPKSDFRSGTVNMTVHAVKDGYDDAGVITLSLTSSGKEEPGGTDNDDPGNNGNSGDPGNTDPGTDPGNNGNDGDPGQDDSAYPGTDAKPLTFTDVTADKWFEPAVRFVVDKGYFKGLSDSVFGPEQKMTRAMFVTVLGRLAGVNAEAYSGTDFQDVAPGQWYTAYVKWASDNSIVNGVGDGRFDPDGRITREQMAAIMYRYAVFAGRNTETSDERFLSFPDRNEVSDYAKSAMIWATGRGIINGNGAGLAPKSDATRAEVAQIIINYSEKA